MMQLTWCRDGSQSRSSRPIGAVIAPQPWPSFIHGMNQKNISWQHQFNLTERLLCKSTGPSLSSFFLLSLALTHHLHLLFSPLDGEGMWWKSVVSSEKGSQSTVTPEVWKNTGKTQEEHGNDTGRTWDEPLGRKMIGRRDCLEVVFTLPCLAAVWCQSCVSENNKDTHSDIAPDLWEKKGRERYCLQLPS